MSGSSRWIVDIQKNMGGEYWTNVYNVLAASLADAVTAGLEIAGYERSQHSVLVTFDVMRVRPALLPSGGGTIVALGGTGQIAFTAQRLPLFNVVRVDFRPAAGRPSRKYLRLGLDTGAVAANSVGGLTAGTRDLINTAYAQPLIAESYFVDVDSQPFTSAIVYPTIHMRQLRRGSKRPVIGP